MTDTATDYRRLSSASDAPRTPATLMAIRATARSTGLSAAELDELPKRVILSLSAATTGAYACSLRAERNKYRALYRQALENLERRTRELRDARGACKRLSEELRSNVGLEPTPEAVGSKAGLGGG